MSRRARRLTILGLATVLVGSAAFGYFALQLTSSSGTSHIGATGSNGGTVSATISQDQPPLEGAGGAVVTSTLVPMVPVTQAAVNSANCAAVCQFSIFTISAPSSTTINHITFGVGHDGSGNVLDAANGNAPVPGCLASWFIQQNNGVGYTSTFTGSPLAATAPFVAPFVIGPTAQVVGTAWFLIENGQDQSACESISPQITLQVSG